MRPDFVHIHQHSQYSKFDGFASVESIVGSAKKFGMPAVGLTDHGTIAGSIHFLRECRKQGVKPMVGMEAYQCRNHKAHDKTGQPDGRAGNRHLLLIAKNNVGIKNLFQLSQKASVDGYYYDPRVDFELLSQHSEGLIVTSACLSNVINHNLLVGQTEKARKAASLFKDVFKDDFYLEMMYHGLDDEMRVLPEIQKLAKAVGVKTIVTNDCHYSTREDAKYHEIIMCISTGKCVKDPRRLRFPFPEFYFKSQEEMAQIFGHCKQSMANTLEIADKCDYSEFVLGGKMLLPHFELPTEYKTPYDYVYDLAWKGLRRLKLDQSPDHVERLKMELGDLKLIWDTQRFDFAKYFLIVWDIMRFADEKGINGGIRGSGFGALSLKCLGVVKGQIDPVKHKLLWERFLGFDWNHFFSESDFGIKDRTSYVQVQENKAVMEGPKNASGVMHDRYS